MTLYEMEEKILKFERELAHLWAEFQQLKTQQKPQNLSTDEISFVKLIVRERFRGSDAIKKGFAKFMEDAKIPYEPVGVEELQQRMAKANLAPDEFSRGIIEMRGECG